MAPSNGIDAGRRRGPDSKGRKVRQMKGSKMIQIGTRRARFGHYFACGMIALALVGCRKESAGSNDSASKLDAGAKAFAAKVKTALSRKKSADILSAYS